MSTTSQSLILDAIERQVSTASLTLVNDGQWANTGTLRVIDPATLRLVGQVTYDFQQDYCHFGPCAERVAAHWYGKEVHAGNAAWVYGSMADLVAAVTEHLLRAKVLA